MSKTENDLAVKLIKAENTINWLRKQLREMTVIAIVAILVVCTSGLYVRRK